ncbi:type II secretion system GspH family protein, partial [bacterium]|nr:type II secretion system GspH family protein [bacterium]
MNERRTNGTRGFTMIEIIVVIAVLAILASVAVPLATVFEDRARAKATADELDGIRAALLAYYEDWGSFPATLADLETGGYLTGQVNDEYGTDGWLHDYDYTAGGMTATVASAGLDFTASTPDDIAVSVTAAGVARDITRREMDQIHVALRNYEYRRIASELEALPGHWADEGGNDGAYSILKGEGLLPSGNELAADGWGDGYTYAGSPVDVVNSGNVGAGTGGGGGTALGSGAEGGGWGDGGDDEDSGGWGDSGDDDDSGG